MLLHLHAIDRNLNLKPQNKYHHNTNRHHNFYHAAWDKLYKFVAQLTLISKLMKTNFVFKVLNFNHVSLLSIFREFQELISEISSSLTLECIFLVSWALCNLS